MTTLLQAYHLPSRRWSWRARPPSPPTMNSFHRSTKSLRWKKRFASLKGRSPSVNIDGFMPEQLKAGKDMIVAVLELDPSNAAVRIVDLAHLPVFFDGGCSVVDVNTKSSRARSAR